jgi:hypothetical protein
MKHLSMLALSLCVAVGIAAPAAAQMPSPKASQAPGQDGDVIYGSQLMTQQERYEYRTRMRSLRTQEEREAFRLEHHRKMQERAKAQGKSLPDMPPGVGPGMTGPGGGKGMGPGMGPGSGKGMGPGMGPGSGPGTGPRGY